LLKTVHALCTTGVDKQAQEGHQQKCVHDDNVTITPPGTKLPEDDGTDEGVHDQIGRVVVEVPECTGHAIPPA
jgi:hypothetical protein